MVADNPNVRPPRMKKRCKCMRRTVERTLTKVEKYRSKPDVSTNDDRCRVELDLEFPRDLGFYRELKEILNKK